MLSYTAPDAAADALRWRHSTLPPPRRAPRTSASSGAAYPWRTIHGEECSGYWPAGTAAFHINADVANAVIFYVRATGDLDFERDIGLEILVETARLWRSLGHYDLDGNFRIDGVTGPDEYTRHRRQQPLHEPDGAAKHGRRRRRLPAPPGPGARARRHARRRWPAGAPPPSASSFPYDEKLGVHQQREGFTAHEPWDFAATRPDQYPLMLHFPYFDLYRKQVVKQPDLVLAMQLFADMFSPEQSNT